MLPLFAWGQTNVPVPAQTQPGQNPANRLEIINTDVFQFAEFNGVKIRKLLGNVHLRQDTTDMFCDSAYQYVDSNYVVAMSRVRIVLSRTRDIRAAKLTYDGETKIINLFNNVVLRDSNVTLSTNRLTYYRIQDYGYYATGGKIVNGDNTLYSTTGYYYPREDMSYFRKEVYLVNPDFILETDTLGYNTETEVAYFLSSTYVYDSLNSMYTEDGYYDTKNDVAFFYQNPQVGDTSYTLFADTITYDENEDLGRAYGNIKVAQVDTGLTVYGDYGEFHSKTKETYITGRAIGVQPFDEDTLYLFADTLNIVEDTITEQKVFYAYYNASFFMNDIQGICDSLVYMYDDSILIFHKEPVLWSDSSQILGDTIFVGMRNGGIDTMSIPRGAFLISQEDTVGFNQIKGKSLAANFLKNKIQEMWLFGNSESIYFTKDEEKGEYIGMNQAKCTDMYITFEDNQPSSIFFKDKPEGTFHPIYEVIFKPNKLEGFQWRAAERPDRPDWVFVLLNPAKDTVISQIDSVLLKLSGLKGRLGQMFDLENYVDPEEDDNDKETSTSQDSTDQDIDEDEDGGVVAEEDGDETDDETPEIGLDTSEKDSLKGNVKDLKNKVDSESPAKRKRQEKRAQRKRERLAKRKPKKAKEEREPFNLWDFFGLQGRRVADQDKKASNRAKRQQKRELRKQKKKASRNPAPEEKSVDQLKEGLKIPEKADQ